MSAPQRPRLESNALAVIEPSVMGIPDDRVQPFRRIVNDFRLGPGSLFTMPECINAACHVAHIAPHAGSLVGFGWSGMPDIRRINMRVHDHRAHYLGNSASLQDVLPGRLRCGWEERG